MEYSYFDLLKLLGSLGLFLFGMKLMSESLQKVAGQKMRKILANMTSNRVKGVFTGFFVTTAIQSSSATTVMIVSFVNAGLLSLTGAIGVIMGANIGTTVTAWIISLLGLGKFSMSSMSLPIIAVSFILMFAKKDKLKSWGEFAIGFAILFMGLASLKSSMPNLKENPEILEFLANYTDMGFASVLIFLGVGTLLTILVQSSSATMALTLVMSVEGWIPFEMAAAMVLGENIGTTITANLAAIVANVSAKRTALAHLVFNLFGVIWMLILFYVFLHGIEKLTIFVTGTTPYTDSSVTATALSLFHSTFNIINTLVMLSFVNFIAKTVTRLIPDKKDEEEEFRLRHMDSYYSTSEISIVQAKQEIVIYANRAKRMFNKLDALLVEKNEKEFKKQYTNIEKYEEIGDAMEIELSKYLEKLSESELSILGSKRVFSMLKIIDNMESIYDCSFNIARAIKRRNKQEIEFTPHISERIKEMFELINASFDVMIENLDNEYSDVDSEKAHEIEHQINALRDLMREENLASIKSQEYKYKAGVVYTELFSYCETLGDHAINISESLNDGKEKIHEENVILA
jgi:phosphate:Na+ symporter